MSLDVPAALLDKAESGPVPDTEFIDCVRHSLPYAWTVISHVAADLNNDGGEFADHAVLDIARSRAAELADEGIAALAGFGPAADPLREFAGELVRRGR